LVVGLGVPGRCVRLPVLLCICLNVRFDVYQFLLRAIFSRRWTGRPTVCLRRPGKDLFGLDYAGYVFTLSLSLLGRFCGFCSSSRASRFSGGLGLLRTTHPVDLSLQPGPSCCHRSLRGFILVFGLASAVTHSYPFEDH